MKLKKIFCLLLLFTVVFTLASCKSWKAGAKCTVTFNSDGGSEVAPQTVSKGGTAIAPTNPTKADYSFEGWYNGDVKWDFSNPVNEDIVLTAKWLPLSCNHIDADYDDKCDNCGIDVGDSYTITYVDDWRTLTLQPDSYTLTSHDIQLPNAPKKAHHTFAGWFSDKELTKVATGIDITLKTDLTFYAKYVPITYTITYHLNDGTNAESNLTSCTVANTPFTLAEPTKDGYNFLGWYTDATYETPITEINSANLGNLNLYAKWISVAETYTITYLDFDGVTVLAEETFYKSNENQPIKSHKDFDSIVIPENYTFSWVDKDDSNVQYSFIPAGTSKNIVVVAFMKDATTHDILYYVNGTHYASGIFVEVDGLASLLDGNKGGYEFDGWYRNAACTGEKVTSIPANTTGDVKLYGKHIAKTYTLKYYDGESELDFGDNYKEYSTSNEETKLPAIPAKEGYTIIGWFTVDGAYMDGNVIPAGVYGNLVLYARYEKNVYTIEYYLNGGENSSQNVTEYKHDEIPTLHDPLPRSGYKFAGWYLDPTFQGLPIDSLEDCMNENVNLYAKWIPDTTSNGTDTPEHPF